MNFSWTVVQPQTSSLTCYETDGATVLRTIDLCTRSIEYIYVHPTSMVGSVGVIGVGPPTLIPSERVLETGAYKVTGFSKLLFPFNLTHALDGFVSAVEVGRGERLKRSSTRLRRGMVYMGSEAVRVGLADEVGSLQKAVEKWPWKRAWIGTMWWT